MKKLFSRLQSGPGLLVLLLVSFAIYFSFSGRTHHQSNSSFRKVFASFQTLPDVVFETVENENDKESEDFKVRDQFVFSKLPNLYLANIHLDTPGHHNPFVFIKVPLFYLFSDIPPPRV